MDARKAFDVVWHTGLFRDLYTFGITGDNWLFFKHRYDNVASKVRWKQNLSDSIKELQGVRQGGVWSPTAYKISYKGDLLLLASAISSDKMRAAIMGISPCANPFCSLFCCSVMALLFLVRWIFSITLPIRLVIVLWHNRR
jgi:hypothetical protein